VNYTKHKKKQWDLANKLVEELKPSECKMSLIDDKSYIMATLPSNVTMKFLQLGLFHLTPLTFTGANKPQIIQIMMVKTLY
jgi:tripeptide aminopeptidase